MEKTGINQQAAGRFLLFDTKLVGCNLKQAISAPDSVGCNLSNFVKTGGRIQSENLDSLTLQVGQEPTQKMVRKLYRGR